MDQNIRDKILDRPRAREIVATDRPLPSLAEIRRDIGGPGVSDEELLLRYLLSGEEIAAMRAAGPVKPYLTSRHPVVSLLAAVAARSNYGDVEVSKPGFSLSLRQRSE
jgi:oxaloacetate decarboxylase alpha subunit